MVARPKPRSGDDSPTSSDDGAPTSVSAVSSQSPNTEAKWRSNVQEGYDVSSEDDGRPGPSRRRASPRLTPTTSQDEESDEDSLELTPTSTAVPSRTHHSPSPSQTPFRYGNTTNRSRRPRPYRPQSPRPSRTRSHYIHSPPPSKNRVLPTDQSQRLPSEREIAIGAPFRGLKRLWKWFWGWEGWIYVQAYFAVPVALSMSGIMVSIAASGPILGDWWWFCTVGDVKLGGVGYCQGETCTTAVFYSVILQAAPTDTPANSDDSSLPISTSFDLAVPALLTKSLVLCVLLCIFALIGGISLAIILYIGFLARCRSSTANASLDPCSSSSSWEVDPEDNAGKVDEKEIEKRARETNKIKEADWADTSRAEKNRMRIEARFRMVFEKVVGRTGLAGLPFAIVLFVWVDEADAQGNWAYSGLIAWVILLATWFITRKMFRATPERIRNQRLQAIRQAKAKAREEERTKQNAGKVVEMAQRGRSRADKPATSSKARSHAR